jgi:hypothetical protein
VGVYPQGFSYMDLLLITYFIKSKNLECGIRIRDLGLRRPPFYQTQLLPIPAGAGVMKNSQAS